MTRRLFVHTLVAVAVSMATLMLSTPESVAAAPPQSCAQIRSLPLANATINAVDIVAPGAFRPPVRRRPAAAPAATAAPPATAAPEEATEPPVFERLPAFCRVQAVLTPTADSTIAIEVWLPAQGWNGKYMAVGNQAFFGSIDYAAMSIALLRGYATSGTDTGHTGNNATFAPGHPEKLDDFAWRAVHEMTVAAKTVVAARYDSAPSRAYFNGCSAGGREGLKEAQRFPGDFDGIIAGAPAGDWTGRASQAMRAAQLLENERDRLTTAKLRVLHDDAIDACDALDGVKDGLLENPRRCHVDPEALACPQGIDAPTCLSPAQVKAATALYEPQRNPATGRETAGLQPGSELQWTPQGWSNSARASGLEQFRSIVFNAPQWTVERFRPGTDLARADTVDNGRINALSPEVGVFFGRGSKLIQYHGWNDPQISPVNSVRYYDSVAARLRDTMRIENSYRLFMVPGMAHCRGGEGPNTFDMVTALEQWVEQGKAPDRIVATHRSNNQIGRTRPLCPYPSVARYTGTGSIDDEVNFVCARD